MGEYLSDLRVESLLSKSENGINVKENTNKFFIQN
jgi:hypothetical protein